MSGDRVGRRISSGGQRRAVELHDSLDHPELAPKHNSDDRPDDVVNEATEVPKNHDRADDGEEFKDCLFMWKNPYTPSFIETPASSTECEARWARIENVDNTIGAQFHAIIIG